MRYAEAEAQLSRMQTILAEHEQLKSEKRRLLDDLQVPETEESKREKRCQPLCTHTNSSTHAPQSNMPAGMVCCTCGS